MTSATWLRRRDNLVERQAERWRPPHLAPPATAVQRLGFAVRRFLDLQFGSIWLDLSSELGRSYGVVLDVGCGAQPFRSLVGASNRYLGIDIEQADEQFGYRISDAIYYSGDRWPVDDASVDLILCTETLEHVREPAPFLAEAARVARPGAQLLLTVPFAARWHFIPHDYWRYTPSSLALLLRAQGFGDVAVYARGNAVTVACYKAMALILPLLVPTAGGGAAIAQRAAGIVLSPVLLVLGAVGNASLRGRGGADCLGYTVTATRVA
ncbi:MAG TPA: class I SAM-dependent methyltransferase [Gemmatirosa sp.]